MSKPCMVEDCPTEGCPHCTIREGARHHAEIAESILKSDSPSYQQYLALLSSLKCLTREQQELLETSIQGDPTKNSEALICITTCFAKAGFSVQKFYELCMEMVEFSPLSGEEPTAKKCEALSDMFKKPMTADELADANRILYTSPPITFDDLLEKFRVIWTKAEKAADLVFACVDQGVSDIKPVVLEP